MSEIDRTLTPDQVRERIQQVSCEGIDRKRVTCDPRSWPKRFQRFLSAAAPMPENESPLLFWDAASFKSGRRGMLLTDHALYGMGCPCVLEWFPDTANRIAWGDVKSAACEGRSLLINDYIFADVGSSTLDTMLFLCRTICRVAGLPEPSVSKSPRPVSIRQVGDSDWPSLASQDKPLVVLFPGTGRPGLDGKCRATRVGEGLSRIYRYSGKFDFVVATPNDWQQTIDALGVTVSPSFVVVCAGRPLRNVGGDSLTGVNATKALEDVIRLTESPSGCDAAARKMEEVSRADAKRAERQVASDRIHDGIMGGVIVGVAVALTRVYGWGPTGFLVCSFLWGWLVAYRTGSNVQRFIGTVAAIVVAVFGPEIGSILIGFCRT